MYCRNKTDRNSHEIVLSRDCFALQWFEDKLGCHEVDSDGTPVIQCVCATDFCNGPYTVKASGAQGLPLHSPLLACVTVLLLTIVGG